MADRWSGSIISESTLKRLYGWENYGKLLPAVYGLPIGTRVRIETSNGVFGPEDHYLNHFGIRRDLLLNSRDWRNYANEYTVVAKAHHEYDPAYIIYHLQNKDGMNIMCHSITIQTI